MTILHFVAFNIPSKVSLKAIHTSSLEFEQTDQEFSPENLLSNGFIEGCQLATRFISQEARDPIILDQVPLSIGSERGTFQNASLLGMILEGVIHTRCPLNGMPEHRKQPAPMLFIEQPTRPVKKRRDNQIQLGTGRQSQLLRARQPLDGGGIHVQELAPLQVLHHGQLLVVFVPADDPDLTGLGEEEAQRGDVFHGGATGSGNVPEGGYVGFPDGGGDVGVMGEGGRDSDDFSEQVGLRGGVGDGARVVLGVVAGAVFRSSYFFGFGA